MSSCVLNNVLCCIRLLAGTRRGQVKNFQPIQFARRVFGHVNNVTVGSPLFPRSFFSALSSDLWVEMRRWDTCRVAFSYLNYLTHEFRETCISQPLVVFSLFPYSNAAAIAHCRLKEEKTLDSFASLQPHCIPCALSRYKDSKTACWEFSKTYTYRYCMCTCARFLWHNLDGIFQHFQPRLFWGTLLFNRCHPFAFLHSFIFYTHVVF